MKPELIPVDRNIFNNFCLKINKQIFRCILICTFVLSNINILPCDDIINKTIGILLKLIKSNLNFNIFVEMLAQPCLDQQ